MGMVGDVKPIPELPLADPRHLKLSKLPADTTRLSYDYVTDEKLNALATGRLAGATRPLLGGGFTPVPRDNKWNIEVYRHLFTTCQADPNASSFADPSTKDRHWLFILSRGRLG
jgi:hypothetical protein